MRAVCPTCSNQCHPPRAGLAVSVIPADLELNRSEKFHLRIRRRHSFEQRGRDELQDGLEAVTASGVA